jgi:hypothetical protein
MKPVFLQNKKGDIKHLLISPFEWSATNLNLPVAKNNIETGQGYWKSLAAEPLGVGYLRFQAKPGLHVK